MNWIATDARGVLATVLVAAVVLDLADREVDRRREVDRDTGDVGGTVLACADREVDDRRRQTVLEHVTRPLTRAADVGEIGGAGLDALAAVLGLDLDA